MTARLVVSISGLAPDTLDAAHDLVGELDARGVPLSLLVRPHRSIAETAMPDWLSRRIATGDELVMHGFGPSVRRRRGPLAHEAGLQMIAARAVLHNAGLTAECFAPSRWLTSPGTLTILRRNGIVACAELRGIRDLTEDRVSSGRLLTFNRQGRGEPWRCRAVVVLAAGRTARRGGLVRIAVDAAELPRPAIRQATLDVVDIALHYGAQPTGHVGLTHHQARRPTSPPCGPGQTVTPSSWGRTRTAVPSGANRSNRP